MAALKDQLRQDAASLQQFVSSIAIHCEQRSGASAYLEPSERFFAYVAELSASTRIYLAESLDSIDDAQELLGLRRDISLIRAGWRFMHAFVKPVLDADTLRLPTSLVLGLTARLREIPRFADTDFVIYHTDDFNYFNVKLSVLKPQADRISSMVQGPRFPDKLGLIGIPYSQASSLFMNCLIPHEMGHYAFGELSLGLKFKAQIEQELKNRLGGPIQTDTLLQIVERLAFWTEEIFCDLFAVRLIGFCFSLAFVELFDVCTVLDENSAYSASRSSGETEFRLYPPNLFRLRQQVTILEQDRWWQQLQRIDSHYVRVLEAAALLQEGDFGFQELRNHLPMDPTIVSAAFFAITPKIVDELDSITERLVLGTDGWQKADKDIALYLQNGIVPSCIRSETFGFSPEYPAPVSLLNAAYKFYLEGLKQLIDNVSGADSGSKDDRARWAKKVEMWTAKAVEDVMLMTGRL